VQNYLPLSALAATYLYDQKATVPPPRAIKWSVAYEQQCTASLQQPLGRYGENIVQAQLQRHMQLIPQKKTSAAGIYVQLIRNSNVVRYFKQQDYTTLLMTNEVRTSRKRYLNIWLNVTSCITQNSA
jgi:hypothetical protein